MKLASRDMAAMVRCLWCRVIWPRAVGRGAIAPTLQAALDDWQRAAPALTADLYDKLNAGTATEHSLWIPPALDAPLPRAWLWLDGSVFPQHAALMSKAFNRAPIEHEFPLMYQGMSNRFLGPRDPVPFLQRGGRHRFRRRVRHHHRRGADGRGPPARAPQASCW